MTSLLAIDASGKVGWAFFATPTSAPRLGTFAIPERRMEDLGRRYADFRDWLEGMVDVMKPAVVAFEAPLPPAAVTHAHSFRFLLGLVAVIEETAARFQTRCIEVSVQDGKQALTGDRRAKKPAMVAAAINRDWLVADDHQADACGVALVAFEYLDG